MINIKRLKNTGLLLSALLILSVGLGGCSEEDSITFIKEEDLTISKVYENYFEAEDDQFMKKANWANGGMFGCDFSKNNIEIADGVMSLKLTEATSDSKYDLDYSGAEYRTKEEYGYGLYSVVMKPAKNDGIVSSFFIYHKDEDGTNWDEIDIEFLGKDTSVVQFNYFVDGEGDHEFLYELGFDASEDYHEYAFLWDEEGIIWFVDGQGVYGVDGTVNPMPDTPGKVMMNLWNGVDSSNMNAWLNKYDGTIDLYAYYESFFIAEVK